MTWGTSPWGVAALAPGELADTVTCGDAMFGYDSTPRPLIASTPPSVIRIAMTQAKTGWWMKKRDMGDQSFCAASPACGSSAGLRSEEHTSELQSLMRISYAVFCLKKKNKKRLTEN